LTSASQAASSVAKVELELLRHHRCRLGGRGDLKRLEQALELAGAVHHLPADVLVLEARLLAQRGEEDERRVIAGEIQEPPAHRVHLAISVRDRVLVDRALVGARLDLERLRVHMAPVEVLVVPSAVEEESGERRFGSLPVRAKEIKLQSIEDHGAPPASVRSALAHELPRDRRAGPGRDAMRGREADERELFIPPCGDSSRALGRSLRRSGSTASALPRDGSGSTHPLIGVR
jgi:hypothetical protein